MKQDVRVKAFKKYHRKRWYEFGYYIFNFEYRITGVDVDQFFFNSKITFDIEIRNITQHVDEDETMSADRFDKTFSMFIDKELGRPKRKTVRVFNIRIRHSSRLEDSFINTAQGFGIIPPSTFNNIYKIGKIKYI